ncbi:MAG: cell division protein FtsQ/DivIB [Gammaproteobacteria bacterium]
MDRTMTPGARPLRRQAPPRAIERLETADGARLTLGRVLAIVFSVVVLVVVGFGVNLAVEKVKSQKIEKVQIEGTLTFVTEQQIKNAIGAEVSTSLISVNLDRIKQKLEDLPWIRAAEIRRQWPDALSITVEEEIAIARWGSKQLLNQQGQVFQPENIEELQQLPLLSGPDHSEAKVMRQYQEFNQLLYPLGVRIRDLTLNNSGSYELTLTNGVWVKLGRQDVLERLRRLVVFLQSEYGKEMQQIVAIDLRYRNGLAVARRSVINGKTEAKKSGAVTAR